MKICIYKYVFTRVYIRVHMYIRVCVCVCVRIHLCTQICTHVSADTYVCRQWREWSRQVRPPLAPPRTFKTQFLERRARGQRLGQRRAGRLPLRAL